MGTNRSWSLSGFIAKFARCIVTESGGPAAHYSNANKEASLVERKVCFISEASNGGGVWWEEDACPKPNSSPLSTRRQELL